jgi:hypothetical protein
MFIIAVPQSNPILSEFYFHEFLVPGPRPRPRYKIVTRFLRREDLALGTAMSEPYLEDGLGSVVRNSSPSLTLRSPLSSQLTQWAKQPGLSLMF